MKIIATHYTKAGRTVYLHRRWFRYYVGKVYKGELTEPETKFKNKEEALKFYREQRVTIILLGGLEKDGRKNEYKEASDA
jgi:hypothetical protein